jgi:acyl-CoA dehydrogenase
MWGFETEPEVQAELDWVERFVRYEVEPADQLVERTWNPPHIIPTRRAAADEA